MEGNTKYKPEPMLKLNETTSSYNKNKCHTIINWIIQILLIISLVFMYVCLVEIDSENLNNISLFLYIGIFIVYFCNSIFFSETLSLLFHIKNSPLLEDSLSDVINSVPELYFTIECFHLNENATAEDLRRNSETGKIEENDRSTYNSEAKSESKSVEDRLINDHKMSSGSVLKINGSLNEKFIQGNKTLDNSENKTNAHISISVNEKNLKNITFTEKKKFEYYSSRDVSGPFLINLIAIS